MYQALATIVLLLLTGSLQAAETEYSRDLAQWLEVVPPAEADREEHAAFSYAASNCHHRWRVYTEGGKPRARLANEPDDEGAEYPKFTPKVGKFRVARAIEDGWLIGFDHGLYWFSRDGQQSYKISNHAVNFVLLARGIHAIEGLGHADEPKNYSIIRIARPKADVPLQATEVVKLPFPPTAVTARPDGALLIVLPRSLVSVGEDRRIETLLSDVPWNKYSKWGSTHPRSSVITKDEEKLYIGMCKFVAEFDLATRKLRLLIARQFLNTLPRSIEERVRQPYR